jgi:hypothetical protein
LGEEKGNRREGEGGICKYSNLGKRGWGIRERKEI